MANGTQYTPIFCQQFTKNNFFVCVAFSKSEIECRNKFQKYPNFNTYYIFNALNETHIYRKSISKKSEKAKSWLQMIFNVMWSARCCWHTQKLWIIKHNSSSIRNARPNAFANCLKYETTRKYTYQLKGVFYLRLYVGFIIRISTTTTKRRITPLEASDSFHQGVSAGSNSTSGVNPNLS